MTDVKKILAGERKTVARAISKIENNGAESEKLLESISASTGNAYRLGLTGPPGAGKSTIADHLIKEYRGAGKTMGVIAVDPTSPFTGGALLGDRLRFRDYAGDEGLFIRSMANRGSLGGLANRTIEVADILDASGKDIILIETVGVGQSELEIAEATDTTTAALWFSNNTEWHTFNFSDFIIKSI